MFTPSTSSWLWEFGLHSEYVLHSKEQNPVTGGMPVVPDTQEPKAGDQMSPGV
jgi:hypothetical protein